MIKIFNASPLCWCASLLLSFFFFTSCGDLNNSDATNQHTDTLSVKKLSTDSNSDMPIAIPKDSTGSIPNAYDSSKN